MNEYCHDRSNQQMERHTDIQASCTTPLSRVLSPLGQDCVCVCLIILSNCICFAQWFIPKAMKGVIKRKIYAFK